MSKINFSPKRQGAKNAKLLLDYFFYFLLVFYNSKELDCFLLIKFIKNIQTLERMMQEKISQTTAWRSLRSWRLGESYFLILAPWRDK